MHRLNNQQGYSLLITLMIIILFTILGSTLILLTFNGTTRNETREDIVQSNDLASKGIDHINAQITKELNDLLKSGRIPAADFSTRFNTIITKYKCQNGVAPVINKAATDIASGTSYNVCIYGEPKNDPASAVVLGTSTEYLRKIVTFKSTGKSGNNNEVLYTAYNIGATKVPEVLSYAVGAYKVPEPRDMTRFPSIPGEGNLILNGGSSIVGDIKVDGNLISSDHGIRRSTSGSVTSDYSVPSVLPQLSGANANTGGRISIDGNMYKFNHVFNGASNTFNYPKHINSELLSDIRYYSRITDINQLFFGEYKPQQFKSSLTIKPIDFAAKRAPIYMALTTSNRYNLGRNVRTVDTLTKTTDTYLSTERCTSSFIGFCFGSYEYAYDGTFSMQGKNTVGRFATAGNLLMTTTNTTFTKGAYVGGNLEIRNSTKLNPSRISGTIYVDKDLTIENAYLESDVILYVNGDVSITESQIFGVPYADRTGSLIIFAKGDINLSNNSVDSPTPSEFKGYFYSEQTMEMYGVGSNIKINGGISARKIILNAVRGTSNNTAYQSKAMQETLPREKSRLQVIYDKDIIKNFSELDIQTEQWIDNISPPTELNRSYTAP